ncbi:MAG: hypothetical protein GY714_05150 [Desulfobacterales bacterium]|nr:hypothetical protein [Desulfobacterales bacterium]
MNEKKYSAEDIKIIKIDESIFEGVDLSKKSFEKNLISASNCCLEFTRTLVLNELPDSICYIVCLGCSYDGNPLEEREKTYPEDYNEPERKCDSSKQVVELLWREGSVPEWINVTVDSEDKNFTYIKLECCGRFSDNHRLMYHIQEGYVPFHVLGPPIPTEFINEKEKPKYDLYWNKNKS